MKRELMLATFSQDAIEVIKKYNIGIEFNNFCISHSLDDDKVARVMEAMRKRMEECGFTSDAPGYRKGLCDNTESPEVSDAHSVFDARGRNDADGKSVEGPYAGKHGGITVHGPFTEIYPQAIDHYAVEMAMRRMEQTAAAMEKLRLTRLVVHSGLMPAIYFDEWHVKQSIKFWSEYMENKPDDFRLYIENVLDPSPEPLCEIIDGIADPRVKLCLDIGHANAVTVPEYDVTDWIRIMSERIGHFHLHNNDGSSDQHGPVMEGSMDMEERLKAIDDHCPSGATFTVESRECDESIAWLLDRM